jgi:ABC-type multidrug transport system fused ATPase/permease subunit
VRWPDKFSLLSPCLKEPTSRNPSLVPITSETFPFSSLLPHFPLFLSLLPFQLLLSLLLLASFCTTSLDFNLIAFADGLVVFCIADNSLGNRVCFSFLQEVSNRFRGVYSSSLFATTSEGGMSDFSRVLYEQMIYFATNPNSEKVTKLKQDINVVKELLRDDIGKSRRRKSKSKTRGRREREER